MKYIDFLSPLHKSTQRDYLARVNDPEFPKHKAAELAKKWDFDYWDGDRRINYGGYKYMPGRWTPVAKLLIEHYKLNNNSIVLDVGCGKAFLLYEIQQLLPEITIRGFDISEYAKINSKPEMKDVIDIGCCSILPYGDKEFDLAFSLNTFHNLSNTKLEQSILEFSRVSKNQYLCVESYRNEIEKANLLYWQVTCEQFNNIEDWQWWFNKTNYQGDYSFIYFE
jgi:protein-L-isoaspartate(D-aspartate) O-methyltransferase